MRPEKISSNQFFVLAILFTIGTTILVIPSGLAADAKQDAWIAASLGVGINLLMVWFYIALARRFPNENLVEYAGRVLGKWPGRLISVVFVSFSFLGASTVLFYMGNFITSEVMPETPIEATSLLFAMIVVMGVRLGVETMARTGELLFPWVVGTFLLMGGFLMPEVDLRNIQPVFEASFNHQLKAAIAVAGTASLPFIVILMIFPARVDDQKKSNKIFLLASLLGGVVIVAITFLCISVMGAERVANHTFPSYAVAKKVDIGEFIQRIEILLAAIWFITVYFKSALYFYGFVTGLAQLCNLKDYRPLVLPSGLLILVFSLVVYPNTVYMAKFDSTVYIPYVLTVGFLLPLLLFIAGGIRKYVAERGGTHDRN